MARAATILADELAIRGRRDRAATLLDRIEEAFSTLRQDPMLV